MRAITFVLVWLVYKQYGNILDRIYTSIKVFASSCRVFFRKPIEIILHDFSSKLSQQYTFFAAYLYFVVVENHMITIW